MAAALGTISVGEAQHHSFRQDRQACYTDLAENNEQQACLNDYNQSSENSSLERYGLLAFGLGVVSIKIGRKAYLETQKPANYETV